MPQYGNIEAGAYTIIKKGGHQYKKFKHGLSLIVDKWEAPEEDDTRILVMPNIPHACQGPGCQPRTIFGTTEWNKMRKACYAAADDTCVVCGEQPEDKHKRQSHELFEYDYANRRAYFKRAVCIETKCHLSVIHSGRAISQYISNPVLFTKEGLLEGVEHGFKLVSEWNKNHPEDEPLRMYDTFLTYCDVPELEEEMVALIKKYGIEFYGVPDEVVKDWGNWRVVVNGKEYTPPYKDKEGWQKMIAEMNKEQRATGTNRFKGDTYDALAKAMAEAEELLKSPIDKSGMV